MPQIPHNLLSAQIGQLFGNFWKESSSVFSEEVIDVGSETFRNPIFQKARDYKGPWILCLALQPGQKLGMIFVEKWF